ncbi:MAG TPA: (2Fe-2S)-binding protein [bacterium]|nr:(2Fe-2S)-binding protein [bacterium]
MSHPSERGVSRRSFLKGSAVAGIATTGLHAAADAAKAQPAPETFGPGEHTITLKVNGEQRKVAVETRTTLLDALRDRLDLTGAKKICDRGACGGCTVLVDDAPVNSCLMLAMDAVGSEIRTVEGLTRGEQAHPLVENFVRCDALQCGFCTPGMVMSSLACLEKRGKPTAEQMRKDLSGNLCRCGTYGRVMTAIERTANGPAGGRR